MAWIGGSALRQPRQLVAWIGLVPAEHSSGKRLRRGEITSMGNAAARPC
ncbi:transposase [Mesorhizobium sp.]